MFREHPGCMSSCAEPLQTDLSSVTGRQLKSPPHPPHPRQPPPSSNRRSAYPRRAHIGTLSNLTHVHLLEPRLFKDISGILTRSHDSEGNGSVRLSLQSRTEAGAGAHTATVAQTPCVPGSRPLVSPGVRCRRPTWAHAEFP